VSRNLLAAVIKSVDGEELENEANAPISRSTLMSLLRAYGRNPRVIDFFNIYGVLEGIYDSEDEEGERKKRNLYQQFMRAMDQIDARIDEEATRALLEKQAKVIYMYLRRIDSGTKLATGQWRELIRAYSDMIQAVGADKDIFMRTRRLPGSKPVRWLRLQKAAPKEQAVEKLRKDDPDLYERLTQAEEVRREVNRKIQERIESEGREPAVRMILNRPVNVGFAPLTGRESTYTGRDGKVRVKRDMLIYDSDGETHTVEEFKEKVTNRNVAQKRLRINPAPRMWPEQLDWMRDYTPEELEEAPGEERLITLSDDPDKRTALTRVYPVKKIDGVDVVTSGRFAGIRAPELINALGRQIEGSIYHNNHLSRRMERREVRGVDGKTNVRRLSEPYVTVDRGRLLIQVPNMKMYRMQRLLMEGGRVDPKDKASRVKGLEQIIPSVERLGMQELPEQFQTRGLKPHFYYFEPKDFAAVQQAMGSLALSASASRMLRAYYDELTRAEQAAESKNLERYSSEKLGLKLPLRRHVKKGLAWLDANGNKGICALDTGMGKTVTAIASIQNLVKKGVADEDDNNGRFLYVCEGKLKGNLPKEMYKFMPKDEADLLSPPNGIVDIDSYSEFNRKRKKDPTYGNDYVAIYFDEAHLRMAKRTQAGYKAAVGCKCKRKVLLTASPMTKSPEQVLTLASVANNIDLNTREGQKIRRNFLTRFAEQVGGRVTGIKQDNPVTAKDFRTWVKRNLFFADKRDVAEEEAQLYETGEGISGPEYPFRGTGRDLLAETVSVTMPPSIEAAYRKEMASVLAGLQELIAEKYIDDEGVPRPELAFERGGWVKRSLSTLQKLSDTPDQVIPGAPNPKLDRMVQLTAVNAGGRTLMWTDSYQMAQDAFERNKKEFPAQGHVLGLGDRILYSPPTTAGLDKLVERYELSPPREGQLVFRKRQYRDLKTGRKTAADEWATHVLTKILGLGNNRTEFQVSTCVLTSPPPSGGYSVGQNLQSFNTVIHLDRDNWSSETMKQRTARAWRAGNKQPVEEYTLDMVYPDTDVDADQTLDEIRRVIQDIDAKVFDQVVQDSQIEKLGEEWLAIEHQRSKRYTVDRQMMERALSPYAKHLGLQEGGS
jgi:hypothetical protein